MSAPYRTAHAAPDPREGQRCCGVCHPAVGGCIRGLTFRRPGLFGGTVLAGLTLVDSEGRPTGTPSMVFRGGRWVPEQRA